MSDARSGSLASLQGRLRFEPALEAVYQQSLRPALLRSGLLGCALAAFIWLLFFAADLVLLDWHAGPWPTALQGVLLLIRLVVLLTFCGVILLIRLGRLPQRVTWLSAGVMYVLFLGTLAALQIYAGLGVTQLSGVLTLLAFAMFLPIGLNLIESVALALLSVLTVLAFALTLAEPRLREACLQEALVMTLGILVGAMGALLRELAHRRLFLLSRELEWQAQHDSLTGLFNRRMFNHQMRACIAQAHRDGRPLALILLDVDFFKLYNDAYGHPAGDTALIQLGKSLPMLCQRPMDMAARVGGEEMALLLYDCGGADARVKASQLLSAVQALAIAHASSPVAAQMSISAGCAMLKPEHNDTSLYQAADQLLYMAKHQGRNRVILGLDGGVETLVSS